MADFDRNAPATKGDIQDMKDELIETVRGIETKLLDAFYGYTKSNDRRITEAEGNEAVLRGRMAALESRITDIEERLNRQ